MLLRVLHWSCLIYLFKYEGCDTRKRYFSTKVKSVRKYVEFLFRILQNGDDF